MIFVLRGVPAYITEQGSIKQDPKKQEIDTELK